MDWMIKDFKTTKNKMTKMKLININRKLLSVLLVLSLTTFACSSSDEAESVTEETTSVSVQKAGLSDMSASHRFSGTVISDRTVQLSTKVTGRVSGLDLEEGDYAGKGSVMIRIKDDNLQAQKNQVEAGLQEAKASLKNAEKNYKRFKALFEKESATQKELDDISTQYEMAKANVQALEAKLREINDLLDYTVLTAPFNGYVVDKRISEGDLAAPGQPLLTFEQENSLKIEVTVPESQISLFAKNDTVTVDVKSAGIRDMSGVISNLNPSGNRNSRQFKVEIKLPDSDRSGRLKSGMFAEVSLISATDASITVPQSAIIERGQLTGLYTLNSESEVILRWVRLGKVKNGSVEVLSGLATGESYIASHEGTLSEGQKVSVQ